MKRRKIRVINPRLHLFIRWCCPCISDVVLLHFNTSISWFDFFLVQICAPGAEGTSKIDSNVLDNMTLVEVSDHEME